MSNLRFLIVDDEKFIASMLEAVLSMHFKGAVVDKSFDPIDALEKIKSAEHDYTLVLSDYDMKKDLTGLELYQQAKMLKPNIPFVIMSGRICNRDSSLAAGADFISKPFSFQELFAIIQNYISAPQGS